MLQRNSHDDRDPVGPGKAGIWPCQCRDSDQACAPTGNEGQSPSVAGLPHPGLAVTVDSASVKVNRDSKTRPRLQ